MKEVKFKETINSLFNGMDGVLSTKTVVGEAITIGDTILLPLVDVSFGIGAGTFNSGQNASAKDKSAGAIGGKMSPCAVLVIKDGNIRLVNVKNQDTVTKILDMVPDIIDKVSGKKPETKITEEDINEMLDEI